MNTPKKLATYIVGGAVRDQLLGVPVQDRDWVVVGASAEHMLEQGFKPVGKDFPVFLHPKTREEYALARTERKTGHGYKGFSFQTGLDVTLEEDLLRRDLTINAMAQDDQGNLFDPYGGQRDLENRIFRHVSPAFAEDPVRILRVARFAARMPDFTLAPETLTLMQQMVEAGEVDHLVPERVWQELSRGLMSAVPSRMFELLRECGALARLMPELNALFGVPQPEQYHPEIDTGVHTNMVADYAAQMGAPLEVRFGALLHDLGKGTTPPEQWPHHFEHEQRGVPLVLALCERLKVPLDCKELAVLVAREHGTVHQAAKLDAEQLVSLLERADALRRPERFAQLIECCVCDARGRLGLAQCDYPAKALLNNVFAAYASINAGAIAQAATDKSRIGELVRQARKGAVQAHLDAQQ